MFVLLMLLALLVVSCGQSAATPTKGTVSVPGIGNPVTPGQSTAAPAPTRKDYPAPAQTSAPGATAYPAPVSAGDSLLNERCTLCHNLDRVKTAKHSADEWKTIVEQMIRNGARLSAAEKSTLIDYLAEIYKK
jgi:hypothetical protein